MSIHNQNVKEYLSGNIELMTYHNPENGFCVLRVKVKNHKDLVTVKETSLPYLSGNILNVAAFGTMIAIMVSLSA